MHLEKNYVETILLLQGAFGNEIFGVLMLKKWHIMFLDGKKSVEFELKSGKLKTVCTITNINTNATVIKENHHQSVKALPHCRIENQFGIHSLNSNGQTGNEASVLSMGTTLPANG